jgi:hypothetical protein
MFVPGFWGILRHDTIGPRPCIYTREVSLRISYFWIGRFLGRIYYVFLDTITSLVSSWGSKSRTTNAGELVTVC